VRTKLEIPAGVELTFVLDDDGCQVDRSDLLDMLPLPALMILCTGDNWTKVNCISHAVIQQLGQIQQ